MGVRPDRPVPAGQADSDRESVEAGTKMPREQARRRDRGVVTRRGAGRGGAGRGAWDCATVRPCAPCLAGSGIPDAGCTPAAALATIPRQVLSTRKRATGPVTAEKATATAAAERAGLCATGRQRRGGQGATPRMREAAKWNSIPPGVSESAQETRAAAVLIQGKGSPEAFLFSVMLRSDAGDGRASHHRADNELNTEYAQRQVKVWSISCFKAGMVAGASVGGRNAPRSSSGLPHGPVEVKRVVI